MESLYFQGRVPNKHTTTTIQYKHPPSLSPWPESRFLIKPEAGKYTGRASLLPFFVSLGVG